MTRRVIFNADDFGGDSSINESVEEAFVDGVLSSASLLIVGSRSEDAIRRGKRHSSLGVGLHVAVCDAPPVLAPDELSDLVDDRGALDSSLTRLSFAVQFSRRAAAQLQREMFAQFRAFAKTGLLLDHVNVHRHMQLHPRVLSILVEALDEFGRAPLRFPVEPPLVIERAGGRASLGAYAMQAWASALRLRARGRGLTAPDYVFGVAWSGAFSEKRLLALLEVLPHGVSELYFHPAAAPCRFSHANPAEHRALISPRVKERLLRLGIERTTFSALRPARRAEVSPAP